ncbi:MAG: SLBB domain-containing protein [Candidatus Daviesbacteria bacterium]|nr:SLBB domain-containing protein [Candidatus Daviesbacteria bacterium]
MGNPELLEKFKIPIALSLVGIVLIIGGIISSSATSKPKQFPAQSVVDSQNLDKKISVDVSGAVNQPGVYQFKDGTIVEEAILAAGGFTEEANTKFISKYLNMAKKISDGMKLYVPFIGEKDTDVAVSEVAGTSTKVININTATQAELVDGLAGVGPVTADKIIKGRPYQKIEDLLDKKIVYKAVFDKIKDQISN